MDPIRLLFDAKNHLMVAKGADGVYDYVESEVDSYVWHKLSSLNHQEIHCTILTESDSYTHLTLPTIYSV